MIYLDNNASTKLDPAVREAMLEALSVYGNPSSVHREGRRARRAIEEARDEVARLVGAASREVFFTSGGTEANAMAVFGATAGGKGRVVRSGAEHPSVREPIDRMSGVEVVPSEPSGRLDPARIAAAAAGETRLVSVMAASNEYGAIHGIPEIARRVRETAPRALLHTDAVQAAGRIPIDFATWSVDLLSLSAHKLHGPKGAGALVVRRGIEIASRTPGGGQEKRLRAGTENTPALVGFGVAARLARETLAGEMPLVEALRDRLERGILSSVPMTRVLASETPRLPNTSAVVFQGARAESVLIRLDLEGIAVSAGSACSSGTLAPSPAVLALGLSPAEAAQVVRFSLSRCTTAEEIDTVLSVLPKIVADIRSAAPTGEYARSAGSATVLETAR